MRVVTSNIEIASFAYRSLTLGQYREISVRNL